MASIWSSTASRRVSVSTAIRECDRASCRRPVRSRSCQCRNRAVSTLPNMSDCRSTIIVSNRSPPTSLPMIVRSIRRTHGTTVSYWFQSSPSTPFGRSTRAISGSARAWSNQWNACPTITASTEACASGIDSAAPTMASMPGRRRQTASISADGSTATTSWPSSAATAASLPVPAPRSSTCRRPGPRTQVSASAGNVGRAASYAAATAPNDLALATLFSAGSSVVITVMMPQWQAAALSLAELLLLDVRVERGQIRTFVQQRDQFRAVQLVRAEVLDQGVEQLPVVRGVQRQPVLRPAARPGQAHQPDVAGPVLVQVRRDVLAVGPHCRPLVRVEESRGGEHLVVHATRMSPLEAVRQIDVLVVLGPPPFDAGGNDLAVDQRAVGRDSYDAVQPVLAGRAGEAAEHVVLAAAEVRDPGARRQLDDRVVVGVRGRCHDHRKTAFAEPIHVVFEVGPAAGLQQNFRRQSGACCPRLGHDGDLQRFHRNISRISAGQATWSTPSSVSVNSRAIAGGTNGWSSSGHSRLIRACPPNDGCSFSSTIGSPYTPGCRPIEAPYRTAELSRLEATRWCLRSSRSCLTRNFASV